MEHHTWAGQALGLAAPRAELSSPLQGHACAACQACQRACRAQQVTCYTTWTLRFELVPCSSLLPHFFSTMYFLLPCLCIREIVYLFHCPWPNATSSHTFLIHHLATALHQAMHQDNTSELVQSKLFQKKPSNREYGRTPFPPPSIIWHSNPPIQTDSILIVLHRPCNQSCAWRKG